VLTAALLTAGVISINAVGQASRSADAATAQAATAQDTEHRQLRAYVGIIPGDVEDFGVGEEFRIRLNRKNYGLTPAYDVGFSEVAVGVVPQNFSLLSNGNTCGSPTSAGLVTMFPSGELPLTVNVKGKLSGEQISAVKQGVAYLFWYGNICYHDAFGALHYTNYCWQYEGADMTTKHADGACCTTIPTRTITTEANMPMTQLQRHE
jgi:hypothetical protein